MNLSLWFNAHALTFWRPFSANQQWNYLIAEKKTSCCLQTEKKKVACHNRYRLPNLLFTSFLIQWHLKISEPHEQCGFLYGFLFIWNDRFMFGNWFLWTFQAGNKLNKGTDIINPKLHWSNQMGNGIRWNIIGSLRKPREKKEKLGNFCQKVFF